MKAVGARLPRYDGIAHVTGRTQYVDDVRVHGTLWCKALRSPHHSALHRLDRHDQGARACPACTRSSPTRTCPTTSTGTSRASASRPTSRCWPRTTCAGRASRSPPSRPSPRRSPQAAVDAIEVEFEEREPILDIRTAADPGAAEHFHQWGPIYPHFGPHNHRRVRKGDVEAAFDEADLIVEGVYRPQAIEHCPMETQVSLVVPEPSGRLTIYSCTQAMYFSMGVVAAHLQWPLNKLKFVGGTVGGGFGGKVDTATETICALLAIQARRPVKWRFTREEEFLTSSTRAPWHIEIRDAVTNDGWILGRRTLTLHDAGAYARFSPYGLTKHAFHHTGAYTIPNLRFDGFVLFTNRVPTTAMRGFGVTSVSLAVELHMSRVAEQLGHGPARAAPEERQPHRRHDRQPRGHARPVHGPGHARGGRRRRLRARRRLPRDDARAAQRRPAARAPRRPAGPGRASTSPPTGAATNGGGALMAKHRGRGFATIEYPTGMNQNGDPSQAWIKLKPDGRVDVFAGTVDIGQGSKTVHTQIVADALGVPFDWVTMDNSNTDSSAVCTGTFASRGTFIGGNAVRYAAEKARERILDIASKELEISADDLEIVDGEVLAKGAPDRKISIPDVAGAATYVYGELITGNGTALKPLAEVDDDDGSVTVEPHSAISYAACVIDVEVDDETGETTVLKMLQVYDVGRAINPTLVEGQIEGGAMMGLGLGLLESSYPYYPSVEHRGEQFGSYLAPVARGPARVRQRDPREPVGRRARSAPRRSARWPTTPSRRPSRRRSTTRSACG